MDNIAFSAGSLYMDFIIPFLEKHPQSHGVKRMSPNTAVLDYEGDLHQITSDIQRYTDEHWKEARQND